MSTGDRLDLLAQVAVWYYEENQDQAAIARRIGRSRSMVSRMLDQARAAGLVEVRVRHPLRTDRALEEELASRLGLAAAHVLAGPPAEYAVTLRRLGELAARRLQEALVPGVRIGVGWGTAVHAVVSALPEAPVPRAAVVQLIGAVGLGDPAVDGAELGRWLAQKLAAGFRPLPAPLIVETEAVARSLMAQQSIREALAQAAEVDVALIGVGTIQAGLSSLERAGYLSPADLAELARLGVVGDILARQLDRDGRVLDIPLNRRVVGLAALDRLAAIPLVMAVAGHAAKAPAILAGLKGGYFNCLVTDAATAEAVLALGREA